MREREREREKEWKGNATAKETIRRRRRRRKKRRRRRVYSRTYGAALNHTRMTEVCVRACLYEYVCFP